MLLLAGTAIVSMMCLQSEFVNCLAISFNKRLRMCDTLVCETMCMDVADMTEMLLSLSSREIGAAHMLGVLYMLVFCGAVKLAELQTAK